jgi:putative SOS response-associated peptidase YedK
VQSLFDDQDVDAIRRLFGALNSRVGNLPSMPGIFPDYPAPIVRNGAEGRELVMARWGMPSSAKALMDATKKRAEKLEAKGKTVDFKESLRLEPDSGTTNIRTAIPAAATGSAGWGPATAALPLTSFSEYDTIDGKKTPVWFALDESRPPPNSPMTAAPIGWVMQASRVETSGWKRPRRLASMTRAATWAGPIIMPAKTIEGQQMEFVSCWGFQHV